VYVQATSTTSRAFHVWTRGIPASDPQEHVGPSLSPQFMKHSLQSPVGLSVQPWHTQRPSQGLCGAPHIHRILACNSRTHRCKRIHKRHAAHQEDVCSPLLPQLIKHCQRGSVGRSPQPWHPQRLLRLGIATHVHCILSCKACMTQTSVHY